MKYLLILCVTFLLACNSIEFNRRSEVINSSAIQVAKKDIPIMEKNDVYFLRIDKNVEPSYQPDALKKSYFYRVKKTRPILFEKNSVGVDSKNNKLIYILAKKVKDNPKFFILLNGFTYQESIIDSFNEHLSEARNLAVKNVLASYGVSPQRVFTQAKGESALLDTSKLNLRRVEVTIGLIKEK